MSRGIRSFVAVQITEELRKTVGIFTGNLRREVRGVRWVRPGNLHLTLKFLGTVGQERHPELYRVLDGIAADHRRFSLTFRGAGVFPPKGRPRVVWIGITSGSGEMASLQADVEGRLEALGFPSEGRSFTPHLTIGRARDLRDPSALTEALADVKEMEWGESVVDGVQLVRSDLFPTGPRYSILHEVRFAP